MAPQPQNVLPKFNAKLEIASCKAPWRRSAILFDVPIANALIERGRITTKKPRPGPGLSMQVSIISSDWRGALCAQPAQDLPALVSPSVSSARDSLA